MGVDIETYSSVDLVKTGTRPYTEAPDFAILLISYKVDDQPTRIIDLTGGAGATITLLPVETADLPAGDLDEFLCLLSDPGVIKTAYNAAFERTCLARYFDRAYAAGAVAVYDGPGGHHGAPRHIGPRWGRRWGWKSRRWRRART